MNGSEKMMHAIMFPCAIFKGKTFSRKECMQFWTRCNYASLKLCNLKCVHLPKAIFLPDYTPTPYGVPETYRQKWNIFSLYTSSFTWGCLFTRAIWFMSSLSTKMCSVLNFGSVLLAGLLNRHVVRLGDLGLISVNFICSKVILISVLTS